MALTKTNYEVKDLGITLSMAYAIIHRIEVDGESGVAEFYIQNSPRDNAFNLKPLERKIVRFAVNRDESPFTTAYNEAKGTHKGKRRNEETGEIENIDIPNAFNGWEDDIKV